MQKAVLMAMYEPSDNELNALMHDVATEAKKKAAVVKKQLRESIVVEIQKARFKLQSIKV